MVAEKRNNCQSIDISIGDHGESLSKKVVRGGIWVFALRFTNRGLGFIWTIVLAAVARRFWS